MSKLIGLTELTAAVQGKLEPVHATQTVTGTNGSITISNALDAPFLNFTAAGMGAPTVLDASEIGGASAQGQQTWSSPLVMDVPLGLVYDATGDSSLIAYGSGVGDNDFSPTAGEETGTTVYLNSKQLADLFYAADDAHATVDMESNGYRRFECPLPFSVAANTTVYCSHLKEQNVSGEEGIWASGSTLYLRIQYERVGGSFESLARLMENIAADVNYYDPMNPKGTDPENFFDFFVLATAGADYTQMTAPVSFKMENGANIAAYLKISDYIAMLSGGQPDPTLIASMTALYYLNSEVNRAQLKATEIAINDRFVGKASLGDGASTDSGGAVGKGASSKQGGAVGYGATESYGGGAVGYSAKAATGGAVGAGATTESYGGGAVGANAKAGDGGAVGYGAKTSHGAAIGRSAVCEYNGEAIDAVQFGTGTNPNYRTMQVYDTVLLRWTNSEHVIPAALLTASVGAMTELEKTAFKTALGIS